MNEPKTPELAKLLKVKEVSQEIGEFLEWFNQNKEGVRACRNYADGEFADWAPVMLDPGVIERILAEYFEIDLEKVRAEKDEVFDWVVHKRKEADKHNPDQLEPASVRDTFYDTNTGETMSITVISSKEIQVRSKDGYYAWIPRSRLAEHVPVVRDNQVVMAPWPKLG